MLQKQFMASWVPIFKNYIGNELQSEKFITFLLSTIGTDGFPKNRTVVYRGFLFDDECTNTITCTTDKRMSKYNELQHNDKFEAVFYLPISRRQFRFKGHARVIDNDIKPVINLHSFRPRNVGVVDSDNESEYEGVEIRTKSNVQTGNKLPEETNYLKKPLDFNLVSPELTKLLSYDHNSSYTNVTELLANEEFALQPPKDEEFQTELKRQWDSMSKGMKKSFRKPIPGSKMTGETQKHIDSIKRGVDGKKDEDGFKNFAVVALFIERVDYFDNENDRRIIFEKVQDDMWSEYEVCA